MKVLIYSSISEIETVKWNSLCSGQFPFERWQHFHALEEAGCVGEEAGWIPMYIAVEDAGELLAATYIFIKNHSYGEYIFDWQWANLAERLEVSYYPKVTSAIPFTPATGAKLMSSAALAKESSLREKAFHLILEAVENLTESNPLSGAHFLFIDKEEAQYFSARDWLIRETFQFHWSNRDYANFEDFLAALKQKKAKEIRRERKKVEGLGLEVRLLEPEELTADLAEQVYGLYLRTIDKKQSYPYLNVEYFRRVFASMSDLVRLYVASEPGRDQILAMSLCYRQGDKLFGRYWGATEEFESLHFELCYYRPIEYAIENKLTLFEAGAQGPHKIQRGFLPEKTYSAHKIYSQPLDEYVARIIRYENQGLDNGLTEFEQSSPYK